MDDAVLAVENREASQGERPNLIKSFNQLPNPRKLLTIVIAAAVLAAAVIGVMWAREPGYKILFTNVSDKDGGQIIHRHPPAFTDQLIPTQKLGCVGRWLNERGSCGFSQRHREWIRLVECHYNQHDECDDEDKKGASVHDRTRLTQMIKPMAKTIPGINIAVINAMTSSVCPSTKITGLPVP